MPEFKTKGDVLRVALAEVRAGATQSATARKYERNEAYHEKQQKIPPPLERAIALWAIKEHHNGRNPRRAGILRLAQYLNMGVPLGKGWARQFYKRHPKVEQELSLYSRMLDAWYARRFPFETCSTPPSDWDKMQYNADVGHDLWDGKRPSRDQRALARQMAIVTAEDTALYERISGQLREWNPLTADHLGGFRNIMGAIKRGWISETALIQFRKDLEQADTRRQPAKAEAERLARVCGLLPETQEDESS
ncbi:hypothetical protein DL546_002824 [Coniochaeta pulveracea]|uniref:HTH CENPB-type domain-containing protein n=1 Tax=Coniochaeta pulveracea TaxID=177199 RepID=A0A420Y697_9PEZI|nr:hypothetical protein DL546_002824 [Coniochaeta pulveracea]